MNYHLDYEVFSRADLEETGTYRYAEDPTSEILVLAVASDTEGPFLWVHPKWRHILKSDPRADVLLQRMQDEDDALIWAHSAQFEIAISRYRSALDGVWKPGPPALHKWRCTAVLARCAALPVELEQLADTLQLLERKDEAGAKLIKLFCIPQPLSEARVLPSDFPEKFAALGQYCLQDVRTEMAVHQKLRPFELRGPLLEAWIFDIRMNDRGFPVNVKALKHAQKIIEKATAKLGGEFEQMTGLRPTQREAVKKYLLDLGCDMPNMKADTVEEVVDSMDPEHEAYPVLKMYSLVQFAAVKKVQVMLNMVCSDGWCRGMLLFYGAGTGRWSGRGVQPQNFKRPTIKGADRVYRMICEGASQEDLELIFGNVLDAMASCIRNFIHWMFGDLLDADYNAVEARIICWLAGQLDRLNDWERGIDQYKMMAGRIYNRPMEEIINPSDEREVGKRTILGCGFGMAGPKFKKTCKDQYGIVISQELADKAVIMYRETHNLVQKFWWACQRAAVQAIQHPGEVYKAGPHIKFWTATVNEVPYLFMRLPSGRKIVYPWPEATPDPERDGRLAITFFGNIKGNHWGRVRTYGGKLAENATQGVAADIMMNGSCKAEAVGADVIMLVHDQSLALKQKITQTQYVAALTDLPPWAVGLPIKAEGRVIPFYKK
jgi:DNA polymerase